MDTSLLLAYLSALAGGAIALTVAWHERRSPVHWLFAAGMAVLAVESVLAGLSAAALPEELAYWENWRLLAMALLPGIWLCFSVVYARGEPRKTLARWQAGLIAFAILPVALALRQQGDLTAAVEKATPANRLMLPIGVPGFALHLLFLVSAVLVLMNLEGTYRAAVGTMRWRIKPAILGLGVLFVARAYTSSQVILFHGISLPLQVVNTGALLVACLLIGRSLLRSGHFEVNVYPSHSVLHSSFTLMLAGAYLLIVGLLAKVVALPGGDGSFTLKASLVLVALVALTVVLMSEKVRLRSKRFVSRHFQRPQYDYRTVWRAFTEATTARVEEADLCGSMVKLVSEVFQVLSVTVWLIDERKETLRFAASTALSEGKARSLNLDAADAEAVVAALARQAGPMDLDTSKEIWAVLLRRLQPDEFSKGGNRVCVPMSAGGELLGVLMLGDRVGGVAYSVQDFDLLKSVSDQAAASLLNIRLSQRLSQGKQLEAFQAMSAFFVHDLKNTAATLSLMLQNLPVHFHDPQFREDALRGVSRTVTHINDIISRLGVLRKELTVHTVESDLNELVTEALGRMEEVAKVEMVRELRPLPRVQVLPGQIQNVVTNLVLNARESLGTSGRIRVETSRRNGWVVLAVSDNGCGMSAEFVERQLFRPFQTTKKSGIGIGMFQCKMIIEAHRGRVEVESKPGEGTAFRLLLPAESNIK